MPADVELDRALRRFDLRWQQDCQVCHGTLSFRMWEGVPFTSPVVEFACPCDDQLILRRWFLVHGIDIQFQQIRWIDATGVPPVVITAITPWIDSMEAQVAHGVGLMLHGTTGSGKTMLAMLLGKALLKRGIGVRVIGASFVGGLTDDWRDAETRSWWSSKIRSAQVLVVDDLGKEPENPWTSARIEDLFRHRGDNMLTTIVSSNLSRESIRKRYGAYTADTIEERCDYIVVNIEASWRAKRGELIRAEVAAGISRPAVFE